MKRRLLAFIVVLLSGAIPVLAQNTAAGPVHVPAGYGTNAAPVDVSAADPAVAAQPPVALTPAPSSSSPGEGGDIHDIRGPVSIPYPFLWALYLVAGAVLAALAYLLWKWLRRTSLKPKLPYEIALERLEATRALMTETQVREYAFAVSEIIRSYIEQRFGERAARRTTEEFLSDLLGQTGTPLAVHRALLEDFLHHCDLPKFARWQLSVAEMEAMHQSARAFILNTRPDAPAGASPDAASSPQLSPTS